MKSSIFLSLFLSLSLISSIGQASKYTFINGKLTLIPSSPAQTPQKSKPTNPINQGSSQSKPNPAIQTAQTIKPKPPATQKSFTHGEAIANCIKVQAHHDFPYPFNFPSKATFTTNIYPKDNYCHIHDKVYRRDYDSKPKLQRETLCMIPLKAKSDLKFIGKITDEDLTPSNFHQLSIFFPLLPSSKIDQKRSFFYDRYCLSYDFPDKSYSQEFTLTGQYKKSLPHRPNQKNIHPPTLSNPLISNIIPVPLHTRISPPTPQSSTKYKSPQTNKKLFKALTPNTPIPGFTTPPPYKPTINKLPPTTLLNKITACEHHTHKQTLEPEKNSNLIIKVTPQHNNCSIFFKGFNKRTSKDLKCLIPNHLLKNKSPVSDVFSLIIPHLPNTDSLQEAAVVMKSNKSILKPLLKHCQFSIEESSDKKPNQSMLVKTKPPLPTLLNKITACEHHTHKQDLKLPFIGALQLITKVAPQHKNCSISFNSLPKKKLKKGQSFSTKDLKCLIPNHLLKNKSPVSDVFSLIIPQLSTPGLLLETATSIKKNPSLISPLLEYCQVIPKKYSYVPIPNPTPSTIRDDKNSIHTNLFSLIAKMTVIYGEQPITDYADDTRTLVKYKDIPSSFDRSGNTLKSVYGKPISIGAMGKNTVLGAGASGTSNWFVTYKGLTEEQCANFLRTINRTKPIAVFSGDVVANKKTPTGACSTGAIAGITTERELLAKNVCLPPASKNFVNLTMVYSPQKQQFDTCIAQ